MSTTEERLNYLQVKFQEGPVAEVGVNGCQMEDVLELLIHRLEQFNEGPLRCRENACAKTHLEEARFWLWERTRKRREQGVEGTKLPHR
jgi:hypothetical protein